MAQSAAADLPPHQGLFNLGGAAAPAAKPTPPRFPGAGAQTRIEPRLVASNPVPPLKPNAAPAARPALSLAAAAAAPKAMAPLGGNAQVQPKPEAAPKRAQPPASRSAAGGS